MRPSCSSPLASGHAPHVPHGEIYGTFQHVRNSCNNSRIVEFSCQTAPTLSLVLLLLLLLLPGPRPPWRPRARGLWPWILATVARALAPGHRGGASASERARRRPGGSDGRPLCEHCPEGPWKLVCSSESEAAGQ